MKHLKKIVAVLAIVGIIHISYSENLGVEEINVIDANTISVMLSENPNLDQGEIEGEVTILHDVSLRGAISSDISSQSVEIMLEDPIMPNTKYSLLTISGADGSIDFETQEEVDGFMASNIAVNGEQNIDSIEILDDRTLIVNYSNDVSASSYEYKLLAESEVTKIEKPDYFTPELVISLEPPLVSNKDYILMFIDMPDAAGNYLEFDTGIYDFVTQEIIAPVESQEEENEEELTASGAIGEETLPQEIGEEIAEDETPKNEMLQDDTGVSAEENPDEMNLDAAPEEDAMSLQKDSDLDTEQAASMVEETPDTGAQTWVLILLTLIINTFYYLSRRKKAIYDA